MARPCTVCTHPDLEAINTALLEGSDSLRVIAERFGLSQTSCQRHKKTHIPTQMAKVIAAQESKEVAHAGSLFDQVEELRRKSLELLDKAERAGDFRTALSGVREARACIELLLEVQGELERGTSVHVHSGQVLQLQQVVVEALKPFPEARIAAAKALAELEAS